MALCRISRQYWRKLGLSSALSRDDVSLTYSGGSARRTEEAGVDDMLKS